MKKLLAFVIMICLLSQLAVAENLILKVGEIDDKVLESLKDYYPEYDEEKGLLTLTDVTDPLIVYDMLFASASETASADGWLEKYKITDGLQRPEEKQDKAELPSVVINDGEELENYIFEQAAADVAELEFVYDCAFDPAALEYAMYRAGALKYTCSIDEANCVCKVKNIEYGEMTACKDIGGFISKARELVGFEVCVTGEDYAALTAENAALLKAVLDNAGMLRYNISSLADYNIVCVNGVELRPGVGTMDESSEQYAVAKEIADGVDETLTDYEKEKAIHDAICEKLDMAKGSEYYADVFCMAMRQCGLEAEYAVSLVNGTTQVWNRVLLDGIWYYTDVYADDTDNSIQINTKSGKKQDCLVIGYAGFNFAADIFENYRTDERSLLNPISTESPELTVYTAYDTITEACDYITKNKAVGSLDFHFIINGEVEESAIYEYAAKKDLWISPQDARYAFILTPGKDVTYFDIYFRY